MKKGEKEYLIVNISNLLVGMRTGQAEFSISTDYGKCSIC